jgi:nucleoside-diphosphate-sugar epimerase
MRVVVTGAAGFIGRALCGHLLARGHAVVPAVRQTSGLPDEAIVGDIDGASDWRPVLHDCNAVVHLAGRVHVMHDVAENRLELIRAVNIEATLNLARQAVQAGVKRFIFMSTIKVNGEGRDTPYRETDAAAPEDEYAISKWEAEQGLQHIARETGLEVVILRPPLVYGPGVKANFFGMMRLLQKGIPLPFGAIRNRRSLVGLDNLVAFIATCLEHPAAACQTFLISDGEDISTSDLLRRVAAALNVSARLFPLPQQLLELGFKLAGKGDLSRRLCGTLSCDISKARTLLGWRPPVSMQAELRRTAACFLRERS